VLCFIVIGKCNQNEQITEIKTITLNKNRTKNYFNTLVLNNNLHIAIFDLK